jgi:dienelactone hydrolase
VSFRVVDFISEGVRLHGELFSPASAAALKLPVVLMAHGWGGVAAGFRPDAVDLARAGFLVMTFDYRGWGESDSRVVLTAREPPGWDDATFTAEVKALRGYVDPFEQVEDWFNAIDWLAQEPQADITRLGLRGSSYSGGHVVYVAARDPRVKAIVSQVGGIADRPAAAAPRASIEAPFVQTERRNAARLARGEIGYPPPRQMALGSLIGAPVGDKLLRWWPNAEAAHVGAAALFILAGAEDLVDNRTNGQLAYERAAGPKRLVVIPGAKHYDIYGQYRQQAVRLAADWFTEHLA